MTEDERKARGLCSQHGTHCKAIEYLENDQERIREELVKGTIDLKDARKSMSHDFERFQDAIKESYVTKNELEPIKKLVYGLAALMLAYGVKVMLL